jgi:hypothetical protein
MIMIIGLGSFSSISIIFYPQLVSFHPPAAVNRGPHLGLGLPPWASRSIQTPTCPARPPLRASTTSSRLVAAAAEGLAAVRDKKKNSK